MIIWLTCGTCLASTVSRLAVVAECSLDATETVKFKR